MGAIGRWIDERCQAEPDVMRHVLNRKFGDLGFWIEPNGKCGCLAGSWVLERGETLAMDGQGHRMPAPDSVVETIGLAVSHMDCHFADQAITIRLLKQRIRKSLGLAPSHRETAVVGAGPQTPGDHK